MPCRCFLNHVDSHKRFKREVHVTLCDTICGFACCAIGPSCSVLPPTARNFMNKVLHRKFFLFCQASDCTHTFPSLSSIRIIHNSTSSCKNDFEKFAGANFCVFAPDTIYAWRIARDFIHPSCHGDCICQHDAGLPRRPVFQRS